MSLNSIVREESVPLAKPHLPLTAITKTSPEAQAAPQEPAARSAEQPAKCGEQQAESRSLCSLPGVSLEIHCWVDFFSPVDDEPRPHLPVTAVSSKQSLDGLSLPMAKPLAGGAEESPSTEGQPMGPIK